jgi:peptidoglycan/LPS O-acetylase OafA/YrhL
MAIVALHMLGISGVLPGGRGRGFEILAWGTLGNALAAFFILSGFSLMLGVVARGGEPGPFRRFYARRAVRVYPAYWLTLFVALVLLALVSRPPGVTSAQAGVSSAAEVVVQLTGLSMPARMIDASMPVGFGVDGVLWFVSVVLGFYLLFPLFARPYARHPLIGVSVAAAITVGWVLAASHLIGIFTAVEGNHAAGWVVKLIAVEQLPGWAFSFGVGMTGAWAYVRLTERYPPERLSRAALGLAPLVIVALGLSIYLFGMKAVDSDFKSIAPTIVRTSPWIPMLYSLSLTVAMVVVLVGPERVRTPFVNRPILRLAELGYGIFLIHYLVAAYLAQRALHLPQHGSLYVAAAYFVIVMSVSALFAYCSLRFVERPATAWVGRRMASDREGPTPSGGEQEAQVAAAVPAAQMRPSP